MNAKLLEVTREGAVAGQQWVKKMEPQVKELTMQLIEKYKLQQQPAALRLG